MEIEKEVINNQLLVLVKGQIDTGTCSEFQRAIVEQNLGIDIICDFKNVSYISSAGLRVILTIHKSQKDINKKFTLKNVSNDIEQIFEMTGFSSFLDIQK